MFYDIYIDNKEISKKDDYLKNYKNIELQITYFQTYLKVMVSYDRVHKLKILNKKINELEKNFAN